MLYLNEERSNMYLTTCLLKSTKSRCNVKVLIWRADIHIWPIFISVMMMMVNSHLSPLSLHADRESLSWPQWLAKKALCLSAGGENNVPFTAHQSTDTGWKPLPKETESKHIDTGVGTHNTVFRRKTAKQILFCECWIFSSSKRPEEVENALPTISRCSATLHGPAWQTCATSTLTTDLHLIIQRWGFRCGANLLHFSLAVVLGIYVFSYVQHFALAFPLQVWMLFPDSSIFLLWHL